MKKPRGSKVPAEVWALLVEDERDAAGDDQIEHLDNLVSRIEDFGVRTPQVAFNVLRANTLVVGAEAFRNTGELPPLDSAITEDDVEAAGAAAGVDARAVEDVLESVGKMLSQAAASEGY